AESSALACDPTLAGASDRSQILPGPPGDAWPADIPVAPAVAGPVRRGTAAVRSARERRRPGSRGTRPSASERSPVRQEVAAARFTAETTARSEAVVMEVAMPTPQTTLSPIAHST